MTDHRIARQKPMGDLLADKPEKHETLANSYRGEVAPYYPEALPRTPESEMYVALAQIKERSNLEAGLRQLSGLIEKYRPAQSGFYSGLGIWASEVWITPAQLQGGYDGPNSTGICPYLSNPTPSRYWNPDALPKLLPESAATWAEMPFRAR